MPQPISYHAPQHHKPQSRTSQNSTSQSRRDAFWLRIIAIVSLAVCAIVAFLILGPRPAGLGGRLDVSSLPTVNAALNTTTTCLLLIGFILIKQRRVQAHRNMMLSAFASSTLFLLSYVVYHMFKPAPQAYVGAWPLLYGFILLTHIVLAASIVPLALVTLYRGWQKQIRRHRSLAKVTLPLWLYVSVTGVLIYVMLYT